MSAQARSRHHLAPTAGPLFDATAGMAAGSVVLGVVVGGLDLNPGLEALAWLLVALVFGGIGWLSLQGAAAVGEADRPAPALADPA